jgi:hypothetical protein
MVQFSDAERQIIGRLVMRAVVDVQDDSTFEQLMGILKKIEGVDTVLSTSRQATSVHVEDLLTAMNEFQSTIRRSIAAFRNPDEQKRIMQEAQDDFRKFCDDKHLPVDFTPR